MIFWKKFKIKNNTEDLTATISLGKENDGSEGSEDIDNTAIYSSQDVHAPSFIAKETIIAPTIRATTQLTTLQTNVTGVATINTLAAENFSTTNAFTIPDGSTLNGTMTGPLTIDKLTVTTKTDLSGSEELLLNENTVVVTDDGNQPLKQYCREDGIMVPNGIILLPRWDNDLYIYPTIRTDWKLYCSVKDTDGGDHHFWMQYESRHWKIYCDPTDPEQHTPSGDGDHPEDLHIDRVNTIQFNLHNEVGTKIGYTNTLHRSEIVPANNDGTCGTYFFSLAEYFYAEGAGSQDHLPAEQTNEWQRLSDTTIGRISSYDDVNTFILLSPKLRDNYWMSYYRAIIVAWGLKNDYQHFWYLKKENFGGSTEYSNQVNLDREETINNYKCFKNVYHFYPLDHETNTNVTQDIKAAFYN